MTELVVFIEKSDLEPNLAASLKESFLPFFDKAAEWKEKAATLVVTDKSQKDLMKQAREARLALKAIRIEADKTRETLKEDSLRYGKAVQGMYNIINFLIAPIEAHLQAQEDFAAIQEKKERDELTESRRKLVADYIQFVPQNVDYGTMSGEDFDKILEYAKAQKQAYEEAQIRLEQARIEAQRIEAARIEQLRIDNEKLRIEAIEREKERQKIEAEHKAEKDRLEKEAAIHRQNILDIEVKRLKAEQVEKERIEAQRLSEEKTKQDAVLAEKKAKQAPDKEKLKVLAAQLINFELPEMKTDEYKAIINDVKVLLEKIVNHVKEKSDKA